MKDSVHALLCIFCIAQMLPSAWNTSEKNQLVKLREKGETSGAATFTENLSKRAESSWLWPFLGIKGSSLLSVQTLLFMWLWKKVHPCKSCYFLASQSLIGLYKILASRNGELQCKVAGFQRLRKPAAKADCNKHDITQATGEVASDRKLFEVVEQLLAAF